MEEARKIVEINKKLRRKLIKARLENTHKFTDTPVFQVKKKERLFPKGRKLKVSSKPLFKVNDSKKAGLKLGRSEK